MASQDLELLKQKVDQAHPLISNLFEEVGKVVVGQKHLIDRLFMGVVLGGHILVEGVPGLAKTTAVKALAEAIEAKFQRIQFTPDLLPADILGTQIYNPKTQEFFVKQGPLFNNIILADEVNRAPAKVQSALLEAMQEKQITIGDQTFKLAEPFLVLATQNPIEQEGTYPLPEAQMDRFLFKVIVNYPTPTEELKIMQRFSRRDSQKVLPVLTTDKIRQLRDVADQIYIDPKIDDYIIRLVFATRDPQSLKRKIERYLKFGASPRASLSLHQAARCQALFQGRAFVVPQDIKDVAADVLRHRLLLTYEAEAEGISIDQVITQILDHVDVP